MNGFHLNTFSITARCKETGMLGVAVSTARPAVGGLAPYVKQGAGAISTQARLNPYFGIDGISYLEQGMSAEKVLEQLIRDDKEFEKRQLAIVDHNGCAVAFTGNDTVSWQGHYVGDQFVCAGNMLVGEEVIQAMAATYENSSSDYFPERLLKTLQAGQKAGGDKRGKQSAALYVVDQLEYPLVDIRADEHPDPVTELVRIYQVWKEELLPYIKDMPQRTSIADGYN